ncbi:hypothetical protein [Mannheimia haemolytica]|nr:hypothetical protein [Mannheimia haemolytica]
MSLKEVGKDLTVNPDFMDERLKEITQSGTLEAVSLIKTLPEKYLGDVQKGADTLDFNKGERLCGIKTVFAKTLQRE